MLELSTKNFDANISEAGIICNFRDSFRAHKPGDTKAPNRGETAPCFDCRLPYFMQMIGSMPSLLTEPKGPAKGQGESSMAEPLKRRDNRSVINHLRRTGRDPVFP
jgi:hypothetical protein